MCHWPTEYDIINECTSNNESSNTIGAARVVVLFKVVELILKVIEL